MNRGGSRLGQSTWKERGAPYHILTFLTLHTKHTLCPTSLFVSMHFVEAESCPIFLFGGSDTVFQLSQLFSNSGKAKLSSFQTFWRLSMNILECSLGPQHIKADANPFHATPLTLCGARPKKAFLPTHMNTSRTWESNTERQGRGGGP